jgi:hypothetical protein
VPWTTSAAPPARNSPAYPTDPTIIESSPTRPGRRSATRIIESACPFRALTPGSTLRCLPCVPKTVAGSPTGGLASIAGKLISISPSRGRDALIAPLSVPSQLTSAMAFSQSSVDPNTIYNFLHEHQQTQEDWYQQKTASGSAYGVPVHPYEDRMTFTLPFELSGANTGYWAPRQSSGSTMSRSTNLPTELSNTNTRYCPSSSSTMSRSTTQSSIWSQSTAFTTGSAPSLVPSRRSQLPPDVADTIASQTPRGAYSVLPCEFAWMGYGGKCNAIFHPHETDLWIDHIISYHLRDKLPSKALCWFCDDYIFDAEVTKGDRRANFDNRMAHISQHIDEGRTVHQIRPDFHFLEHLTKHKLVSKDVVDKVTKFEGPAHSIDGIYNHDYVPEEHIQQIERSSRVTVDQVKEDRKRERERRKQGQHRGHGGHGHP